MNKEQVLKLLKVCLIATAIMLACEIVFSIDVVINFFGNLITKSNGWIAYLIIWVIMFLQVTVLNIPAYVVLSAGVSIGIDCLGWKLLLTVISAYMAGCILAYWLGRWFGTRAIKWCAGSVEDFEKWSKFLNEKGKLWYFLTVLFPFFPDDLLCLVAGGVKFNFGFFTLANFLGRSVGLVTMVAVLYLIGQIGGGFPFMIIVWGVALLAEIITYCILIKKNNKKSSIKTK